MSDEYEVFESDIAIVGMAARVPGALGVEQLWQNLAGGVESVRTFTDEELLAAGESAENLRHKRYVKAAAPLPSMEMFDGEFFGFSPKECAIMDPQHRHFLEVCWEALENAAHPPERFDGPIGVFAGCGMGSYFYFHLCTHPELVRDVGMFLLRHTGNDKDFLATRVSYLFDLRGPSIGVQTACSTSLVATHLACQSLLSRECDLALAGGVTIELPHRRGYFYQEGEILSPTGHCHAFDHRAAGTVFGSGAGAVALRRLGDALDDGDVIHAVIRGSAVNNDGSTKVNYLAPSVDGQAQAMVEAYDVCQVDPRTIEYIECHGTGTYLGDPIEIEALTQAFRSKTDDKQFCKIGSIKSNIGHLDTAAGVVSLIKATLALKNATIPPSLNYEAPNPTIDFARSPFIVASERAEWPSPAEHPRRAAVNSLGVGGTNAHVVLQEPPALGPGGEASRAPQLLCLSAKSGASLDGGAQKLAAHLRAHPEQSLADVAWTLHRGRRAFDRRRVVAATTHEEAARLLEAADPRRVFTHLAGSQRTTNVFLLPGGGAQYTTMAAGLYEREPVFKEHVDRGLAELKARHDIDLAPLLFGTAKDAEAELDRMPHQLPAIFIVSVAMARLFESWDVRPDALLGHSLGQNTAAHLAGVMSFSDCLGLVVLRGRLFEKTAEGAMLSVAASASTIEPLLDGALDLAVVNAPDACVVSGPPDAVAALEAKLTEAGEIEVRRLAIPTAAHSRLLDPILGEFGDYLRSIELKAPSIPVLCNTTGGWLTDRDACDPDYWVRHLRSTVRFADDVETVLAGGARILIECGPGRALSSLARGHHAFGKGAHNALHTIRHKDDEVDDQTFFVTALGRIWASGGAFELDRLFEGEERVRVELPTYAWNHKPYFVEPLAPTASAESATDVAREDDVEAWGWRPRWKPAAADPVDRARHTWLLFMDDAGIGRRIEERLRERGDKVVCVYEGDAYVAKTDHHFALSPERGREGYAALVRDLVARGLTPDRVVHLWLLEAQERFRPGSNLFHHHQERGFYSLLFLAQALGEEGVPPLELTVVTNGMQRVSDEPLPYPDKATVLGPVRVIPRELEGYVTRSVDVTMPAPTDRLFGGGLRMALADPFAGRRRAERSLDELSDRLLEELLTAPEAPNGVDVTAWRGDRRFVWTLDPVPLEPVPLEPARETIGALRRGGHYVITGGLGGIGLTIAEALGRASGAKLTLLSRTALPPREQWASWIRQHGESDRVSQRLRRLLDVEAAGAELAVHCADVTHVDELTRALGAATDRFGPIHGLLHTAGTVADELIAMKTPERAQEVLTPKVQGTRVLDEVLAAHPPLDFMVLFSSTSTATAPPGQVDYVAANAFLDAYAQARAGEPTRVTSLHWGIWRGVGMAAEASGQDRGTPGEAVGEQPSHPLLDARVQAANGRSVLEGTLSTARDWVLDGHRTKNGHALLPGTGYLELARAALEAYGERGAFEIEDLFFIRPFAVADDTDRAIRVGLTPTERGYAFEVRGAVELEGQRGWELHAQAQIALRAIARPTPVQPSAIADRCARHERAEGDGSIRTTQEKHLRFGPRWGVLRERWLGDGEGLARLALPDRFANETRELGLHPALLDIATGWAMELIEGYRGDALWVPISYERVRVHAPLPPTIVSHVRNAAPNRDDSDFVSFDVTLATADGQVLVEVDRLSLRKMTGDLDFAVKGRPSRSDVELEARADEGREPSPQERALAQNLERGIQPAEGADAFLRVLAGPARPEIFVSSMPLPALISQAARTGRGSEAGESLKLSRPELDSEFVEARDEVEKTLVTFWQELLGVDTVGVRDSFFDLGGHSLIAVRLFAKVKKAYSVEFPISVLFEAPTIERCASMIKATIGESASAADEAEPKPKATRYTHLVPMHAGDGGPKTPFFLVAGMFGNVLNLRHLAHLVGTDRRFYGLQARGLYGDQTPHETFDEMAKAYLEEMRTVQPSGPYLLGGFSGGGITAYEIAQQLVAAGEEVALLVFLDTPLPFPPPALSLRDRARIQTQQLQEKGAAYLSEWAVNRWNWEVSKLKKRFDEPEPDRTGEEFHDEAIEAAFRRALGRYELRKYPGSVCLFRPRLEVAFDLGEGRLLNHQRDYVYADNGWTKYVGSLDVEEVPGDHDSMVLEPNVRVLAARFRQAIERAEDGLRRRSRDARLAAEE